MSLELASTEELIEELHRRSTFVGIIIRSKTEHKYVGNKITHNDFDVFDATGGQVETLLDYVVRGIKDGRYEQRDAT
jgi:hypothetical protein